MPHHARGPTLRLRHGLRVTRRSDGQLQVGLHPDDRAVLPDADDVRGLLRDLTHGVSADQVTARVAPVLDLLRSRGLVVGLDEASGPAERRAGTRVGVVANDPARATVVRLLALADLQVAGRGAAPAVMLHVTTGAEPRREVLDQWVRDDLPHLTLTSLAGRTRLGPFVVPGRTACLRCVDEHATDRDPRHPLVLEQHHAVDPGDPVRPEDLQLALAWAVRDLACWADGRHPVTWSATVEVGAGDPGVHAWRRHPRCGCAWGDLLAG
ncbi:hypothetical protein [Nocardioides sp. GXQ0305]|uniref:hypothetical protein n=1 Tax=Nocardioides sp. GXQ0305 TaxID=3423912 RepID=UPI003D7E0411